MLSDANLITVEVVYAEPDHTQLVTVELAPGSSVADAERLVAPRLHTPIALAEMAVGIFGEVVSRSKKLKANDRVEYYRPLHQSAKEARIARAEAQADRS